MAAKYSVAAGKTYDLRRVQERLPPDAALVAWVDIAGDPGFKDPGGAHWVGVVRHRGDPVWVRLPGGGPDGAWQAEDEDLPAKVRGILADRGDTSRGTWRDPVRKLYAQRLAPLEGHLGSQEGLPAVRHLIVRARPSPNEVRILFGLARQLRWFAEHRVGQAPDEAEQPDG